MDTPSETSSVTQRTELTRVLTHTQQAFLDTLPRTMLVRDHGSINLSKTRLGKDYPDLFKKRFAGRDTAKTVHISSHNEYGNMKPSRFLIVMGLPRHDSREIFFIASKAAILNLKLIEKIENRSLFMTEQKRRLDDIFNGAPVTQPADKNNIFVVHNKYEADHVKRGRLMMIPQENYLFEIAISSSIDGDRLFINIKDMLTTPLSQEDFDNLTGAVSSSDPFNGRKTPPRKRKRS